MKGGVEMLLDFENSDMFYIYLVDLGIAFQFD